MAGVCHAVVAGGPPRRHSRNGKQTLIAAAYDDRLLSVAGSSPGFPIATPARFASNAYAGEQWPSSVTGAGSPCPGKNQNNDGCSWWAASAQQYYGRAPWLPADGHFVTALIAPRHFVIGSAHNDHDSDNSFGAEMNLKALRPLHALLRCEGSARVMYRPGDHVGLIDVNGYFDLFQGLLPAPSPATLLHEFDWDGWRNRTAVPPPPGKGAPLAERVQWVMGERLPALGGTGADGEASEDYIETLLLHDALNKSSGGPYPVARAGVGFGDSITGELYYPANWSSAASGPLEVVIVLPGYFYNTGFSPGHYSIDWTGHRTGEAGSHGDVCVAPPLAQAGLAADRPAISSSSPPPTTPPPPPL